MMDTEDRLLRAVLSGDWPVPGSLLWALSDGAQPPPVQVQLAHGLPQSNVPDDVESMITPTPAAFRESVLSCVRDQAELILRAAEAVGSSRPCTPGSQEEKRHAPKIPEASGRRAAAEALRKSRLEQVSRRLAPGTVDDFNFPALGGAAPSRPVGGPQAGQAKLAAAVTTAAAAAGGWGKVRPAAISPRHVQQLAVASTAGVASDGSMPRRRIVPTLVPEAEASVPFINIDLTPQSPAVDMEGLLQQCTSASIGVAPGGASRTPFQVASAQDASWQGRLAFDSMSPGRAADAATHAPPAGSKGSSSCADVLDMPDASGAAAAGLDRRLANMSLGNSDKGFGAAPEHTLAAVASPSLAPPAQPPPLAGTAAGGAAADQAAVGSQRAGRRRPLPERVGDITSPPRSKSNVSPQKRPAATSLEHPSDPDGTAPAAVASGNAAAADAPTLSAAAQALAALHAGLLQSCPELSLAREVELLLNLLAVPAAVKVGAMPVQAPALLWCGLLAQQYAAAVLQQAGGLLRGLGPQLLQDLAAAVAPVASGSSTSSRERSRPSGLLSLQGAVYEALQALRSRRLRTEKAYNQIKATGIVGLYGLTAFTSDGHKSRSTEEQRRISNREACRDSWFALMRDAAAHTHSFGGRAGGAAANGEVGSAAAEGSSGSGGDEAAVLAQLQRSAGDLLRALRPDNFCAFAELFTAAVLQAAATGEPLLDEELTDLAKRNVSRFHSLNQRMQGKGAVGPGRGGAACLPRTHPGSAGAFGGSGGGQLQQKQRWPNQRHAAGKIGGGAAAAGEEAAATAGQLMADFPRPMRLYVLFLEAADSHRLNLNLIRCMSGRLRALAGQPTAGGDASGLGERVVAMTTLAGFLGYLAFTRGCSTAYASDALEDGELATSSDAGAAHGSLVPPEARYDGTHPVDVAAALSAAERDGGLPRTLPWVVRYLGFLRWDSEAQRAPYFQATLASLAQLRRTPELSPGSSQFGLAAFCLRALLDDFVEKVRAGALRQAEVALGAASAERDATDSNAAVGGASSILDRAGRALAAADPLVDARYIQLCCPVLEHGRHLFRSSGAGDGGMGPPQPRTPKKIRPTAPLGGSGGAAAARLAVQLPAAVATARAAGRNAVKLRLQRAFLEQYSAEEQRVKLKEVVEYVSDVIACNAATSAAAAAAPKAIEAAAAPLAEGIQARAALGVASEAVLRQYALAAAEQAIRSATEAALQAAYASAQEHIRVNAARAMQALTAPELGEAVIGTAAAIVAEAAEAACAERLISSLQSSVRQALTRLTEAAVAAALKSNASSTIGAQPAAEEPLPDEQDDGRNAANASEFLVEST